MPSAPKIAHANRSTLRVRSTATLRCALEFRIHAALHIATAHQLPRLARKTTQSGTSMLTAMLQTQ